jgi:hypothetical protein
MNEEDDKLVNDIIQAYEDRLSAAWDGDFNGTWDGKNLSADFDQLIDKLKIRLGSE